MFIQESFGLFKDTKLVERLTWQFRLKMSNPFNRVVLGSPAIDLAAANFGLIGGQGNSPRVIHVGMKLIY